MAMTGETILLHGATFNNTHPILPMRGSEKHVDWVVRSKIESDKKLPRFNSDLPATAAVSYYYHTSTFPSLFGKLQPDQKVLKQTDKFGIYSEPRHSRSTTASKSWHSKQERKDSYSNTSVSSKKTSTVQDNAPYQAQHKFSSINGISYNNNAANSDISNVPTNSKHLSKEIKAKAVDSNRDDRKITKEETVKNKRVHGLPQNHREITKLSDRPLKHPIKPVASKSATQRSSRVTPRGERLRSLSFVHFNASALNNPKPGRHRSFNVNKHARSISTNRQLFPSPSNKHVVNYKNTPLLSARPWTSVKPGNYSSVTNRHKQTRHDPSEKNNNVASKSLQDNAQLSALIHHRRKTKSERPKTNHVRFREIVSEEKTEELPKIINSETTQSKSLTECNPPKWISSLSNDNVKLQESKPEPFENDDADANVSLEVSSSNKVNSSTKTSEQLAEKTVKLSLDQLRLRDRNSRIRTTDLLSTDQLIIRESIEKVQKWLRTLPKHFDAIHHVSTPVQQNY